MFAVELLRHRTRAFSFFFWTTFLTPKFFVEFQNMKCFHDIILGCQNGEEKETTKPYTVGWRHSGFCGVFNLPSSWYYKNTDATSRKLFRIDWNETKTFVGRTSSAAIKELAIRALVNHKHFYTRTKALVGRAGESGKASAALPCRAIVGAIQ